MTQVIYTLAILAAMALALAFVLPPLLRRRRAEALDERQAILAAHRARFVELDADRESGNITEAEYREAREELERQILEGASAPGEKTHTAGGGRWMAWLAGALVPAVALGVYLVWGHPEAVLAPVEPVPDLAEAGDTEAERRAFIEENLPALERRAEENPTDAEAARMLARAYLVMERPSDAARVLGRTIDAGGAEPTLLVDRARALAMAGERGFTGEPRRLLEQALEIAPGYPDALWFAGLAAAQAGDTARARALWQRLLTELPEGSESAQRLEGAIARLGGGSGDSQQGQPAAGTARVQVDVRVGDGLAEGLSPETTVFVFARDPEGPPAPVTVQRLTLSQLPARVELSGGMAGRTLADVDSVQLVARVSRSGGAQAESGDLQGETGPVPVGGDEPAELVIDRRL
ncbi:c-type cytochrome biogenesis protein CcmI [Arhodomonas sp. SL1]|uniref:c-type cytochrome biogenesis protein CcmI n=1 Tax=Arhodomonas sp. SL1 TaxID=3425691 RepID=UPI003F8807F9